jgi:ATP adenylyltransferase
MAYVDQPGPASHSATGAECVFCAKALSDDDVRNLVVARGEKVFALLNLFPYNNGHVMVVPYVHISDFQQLDEPTMIELMRMTRLAQMALHHAFHPEGYNIGMNVGRAAGAGIADHIHLHIDPRWNGDTNFMPVLGDTKVLPDALEATCIKIRAAWSELASNA